MTGEDELIMKVINSYTKCDDGCIYRHHMVDINDSSYTVAFCDHEMEAIVRGTHCIYYKQRGK